MKRATTMNRSAALGFTLLEVLIALMVLSVGLLGLANLQILGLRSNQGAFLRSQATVLAEELAERMQSTVNPTNAFVDVGGEGDNDNDDAYTVTSPYADALGNANSANVDCNQLPNPFCSSRFFGGVTVPATACTPAQMATFDFYNLVCGIDGTQATGGVSALPGGWAMLICNDADAAAGHTDGICVDGSTHTVTVRWDEIDPRTSALADPQPSVSYTFVP